MPDQSMLVKKVSPIMLSCLQADISCNEGNRRHLHAGNMLRGCINNRSICKPTVYVVVQFFPWCNFFSFVFNKLITIHVHDYHITKQRKMKFTPRIKLNHNIYNIVHSLPTTHHSRETGSVIMLFLYLP